MNCSLSIHQLEGHLDCFQNVAVMNKAALNIYVHKFSTYFVKY